MENLAFILWPERKIHLPPRQGAGKARFQKETLALDEDQAKLSLRLPSGHQIIKPPGVERPSYWYIGVAICTDTILT